MKYSSVAVFAAILVSVIPVNESAAYTWHVPSAVQTIKSAVEDSAAYGDTVLVAPGVYSTTTGEAFPINMTNGIILTSESGASLTTIDANTTGSVIRCISCDQSTEISGFTVTGGYAENGGGIYCDESYLTIRENIISNNTAIGLARGGGGIYCASSEPTIAHNTITENESQNRFGGGIYTYFCTALIEHNMVANNTSTWGAGIFNDNSSSTIQYNIIKGNHSILSGGGLDCYMYSSPYIIANVVVGNSSGTDGAGIACCYSCSPYIQHNTIAGNVGNFGGGVRSLGSSSPTVMSNIIIDNIDGLYLNYDSGSMLANDNIIYCNTYQPDDFEVINNTYTVIDVTNNFWWVTDAPSIGSLINGPANFQPFHIIPPANTPNEPSSVLSVAAMTDSTYTTPLTSNLQIGDTVYVQLTGNDSHSAFVEPALVILQTTRDPYGIAVALIETDTATGVYQGRAFVSTTSDDAADQISAYQNDTLFIISHIDTARRDTVFIGSVAIGENDRVSRTTAALLTTIISGPLHLPAGSEYRLYDIAGRHIQQDKLMLGVYFLEIDGVILNKIIKVN